MELIFGLGIVAIPLFILFVWVFPILIIAVSPKVSGPEKLAWILAVIFISWFAWILFLLLAPVKKQQGLSLSFSDQIVQAVFSWP